MTLGLGRDHEDLRDVVRTFVQRCVGEDVVRAAIEAPTEQRPPFWTELGQQGLLALHLPESCGGGGHGLLEAAVVAEELGRALAPGPFLPTVAAGAMLASAGHRSHLPGLADGTIIGAVAREAGLTGSRVRDGLVVDGTVPEVVCGVLADVLVAPVSVDRGTEWVVIDRRRTTVTEQPSLDSTRRLATVRVEHLVVDEADVLDIDDHWPSEVAVVLAAAEASGLADACTAEAAAYARQREQFGRPIGQFQAVKHRTARMLVAAEQARACAWDAARAVDGLIAGHTPRAEAALAAAVAGSIALDAASSCAKDLINTLGGIGFTWEHLAGFRLRRAQAVLVVHGPAVRWHRRVAAGVVSGVRRHLAVELPERAEEVREEIRDELAPATRMTGREQAAYLAGHGYTAPHYPRPWGKAADAVTQLVIDEELAAADLQPPQMVIGNWVLPTLLEHGSRDLQERLAPASLRGDLVWCQLFSEPGAGSDLAALSTRAVRAEDPGTGASGWRVTGQKVWTSRAHEADFGILLARTDATAPKHEGISYFVLDMSSPGIEVRPLRELTGETMFNEVFLDDVFVPDEMLVGEPGQGWRLARTTLANERVSMTTGSALGDGGDVLVELFEGSRDQVRRARLGELLAQAQAGRLLDLRATLRSVDELQPGPETSISKLLGVEHIQQVWETAVEWQGSAALSVRPDDRETATWRFLSSRSLSIAGGTTDIQLNIIGERLLGLPRDPEPDR